MGEPRRSSLVRRVRDLTRPYPGDPPAALSGRAHPDLFTRVAGLAVPHFVSLVARLGGDRELPELPAAVNRLPVRVVGRRRVAVDADVVELRLAAPDGAALPLWHPGAHIDLDLPSGRTRQYSLCGDPAEKREYRIAVRRIAGGDGSGEVHGLPVGQTVRISRPRNAFIMALPGAGSRARRLRFVAGGIGITPILPMVRLAERAGVPWSLCYTGRHRGSLPFLDELSSFGDKVRVRTDDEAEGLPCAAELLEGVDEHTAVYVCGPAPMIEAVGRAVPAESATELHIERFTALPVVDGAPFELELASSAQLIGVGRTQTALAALRAARPTIAYSCQQGFCGTCVQRVLVGEVDHRDRILTDWQREQGQMLVCVSRARAPGGRLLLDL